MKHQSNNALRKHSISMIGLLVVAYIIGMVVNMYVEFPESATAHENWQFAMSNGWVLSHILVGTLLVLGVVALYVRAIVLKDKVWKIAGGLTTGAVVLAWVCGEEFVTGGNDIYSFAMSAFFVLAVLALGWGVSATNKK